MAEAEGGHGHGDHDHGDHAHSVEAHSWLDPAIAALWVGRIAETLAEADPEGAETYRANAAAARARIAAAADTARATLAPVRDRPILVAHDAWGAYERAFGLTVSGAMADGHAAPAGAARLSQLQRAEAACFLAEPDTSERQIATMTEGRDLSVTRADPLGGDIAAGADLYPTLIESVAERLAGCLSADG